MQLVQWERFVPDVEQNRDNYAQGKPAITVMVRPPSARVWRRFWLAMMERPHQLPAHLQQAIDGAPEENEDGRDAAKTGLILYLATLDDTVAEILFLGCVGEVSWPESITPGFSPKTGEQLWAARDQLPSFKLYQSVLEALINRARLQEGLVSFLASGPGPEASDREVNIKGGTAKSVESAASTG